MKNRNAYSEVKRLGTHQAAAANLHRTRTVSKSHTIGKPVSPGGPGIVDPR